MTIILHSKQILFLKAKKVAGTSLEFALSSLSEPCDVIAPCGSDEQRKDKLNISPRNYKMSSYELLRSGNRNTLLKAILTTGNSRPWKFSEHMSANELKDAIGAEFYEQYFKIAIVRNPFSVTASVFYYLYNTLLPCETPNFTEWLTTNPSHINVNHRYYFIDSTLAVDCVLRFESLSNDLNELCRVKPQLAGLSSFMEMNHVNRNPVKFRQPASELFIQNPLAADLVRKCCRLQFSTFGYSTDPAQADNAPLSPLSLGI